MCRVRRVGGIQNMNKRWLSSQSIQETEQKQRRFRHSIKLGYQLSKGFTYSKLEQRQTKISCAQGTAAGENPNSINSLMAKNQTTTKPVPRANLPIAYVQYRSFLLAAIYGRFALSPIYLSLWIAYLLADPRVLSANLVFYFYKWAREHSV